MAKHLNLYYLFREDQRKNPMPAKNRRKIRKKLERFSGKLKPPRLRKPLIGRKGDNHSPVLEEQAPEKKN